MCAIDDSPSLYEGSIGYGYFWLWRIVEYLYVKMKVVSSIIITGIIPYTSILSPPSSQQLSDSYITVSSPTTNISPLSYQDKMRLWTPPWQLSLCDIICLWGCHGTGTKRLLLVRVSVKEIYCRGFCGVTILDYPRLWLCSYIYVIFY